MYGVELIIATIFIFVRLRLCNEEESSHNKILKADEVYNGKKNIFAEDTVTWSKTFSGLK